MKSKSRNKIEKIIIGNLGNAILHEILAISVEGDMKKHYKKEMLNSFKVALKYRNELSCEIFIPVWVNTPKLCFDRGGHGICPRRV